MAEAGIKISQLSNVTLTNNDDYTVIVHNGVTCKTTLNTIRNSFSTNAGVDTATVNKLRRDVTALSNVVKNLPYNYLSSSLSGNIRELSTNLNTLNYNYNKLINTVNQVDNNITDISTSINFLSSDDIRDGISALIELLVDENGKAELLSFGERILNIEKKIDDFDQRLNTVEVASMVLSAKENVAELDSRNTFNATSLNNIPKEKSVNPIYINQEEIVDGYDFYYDENRFANIPTSGLITYTISGLTDENTAVTFLSNSYDSRATSIVSGNTHIDGLTLVRFNGLSVTDTENSALTAVSYDLNSTETEKLSTADPEFPGEDTCGSKFGIPLRYGMLSLVTQYDEDDPIVLTTAELELSILTDSKVKLYLNKSSYISNGTSIMNVYLNDNSDEFSVFKLLGSKKSNKAAIETGDDLELFYDGKLDCGSQLKFEISKVKNADDEDISLTDLTSDITLSNTLFGMIVPMVSESQLLDIEVSDIQKTSTQEDNENGTTSQIDYLDFYILNGMRNHDVGLSAFYLTDEQANTVSDFSKLSSFAEFSTDTKSVKLTQSGANACQYIVGNVTQSKVYIFAEDIRTGNVVFPSNNGDIVVG